MKRGGGPKIRRKRAEFGNSVPTCPPFLSDVARTEWHAIVDYLRNAGLLSRVDQGTIAAYCSAFASWKKATEVIEREGPLTKNGKYRPEYGLQNKALVHLEKFARLLLISPASRAQAGKIDPPKAKSPMRRIMEKTR